MGEFLRQLQADIGRIWSGLSRTQQVVFAGVVAASVVAIALLVIWAQTPEWTPLFTNLENQDAGTVVEKLKEAKVPYQVSGSAIMVPKTRVHELRLSLAAQGLPQGGTVGFELFDKNQFGMTDSLQKLNYQRALQGELIRTIQSIEGVDNARVHLVLPEKDLFSDTAQEPSAAVVLKLRSGARLSNEQVKSVLHLVAKSVQGLKEANVALTDVDGRNYTEELGLGRDSSAGNPDLTMAQLDIKKQIESRLARSLQGTLDRVLGANNSVVNVSADLDFSQQETNAEIYEPVTTGEGSGSMGILRSTKEMRENYDGAPRDAAGVPGVTSNVTGGMTTYPASGSQGAGSGRYDKSDNVRNYEITKTVKRQIKAPAEIKRLSVSVLLNGEFEPQQLADFKQMIEVAAGANATRGDAVVVTAQKFNDEARVAEQKAEAQQQQQSQVQNYLKIGIGLLVGVIALVLLRRGLLGRGGDGEDGPLSLEGFDVDSRMAPPVAIGTVGEDDRKTQLQREITKVVQNQPATVSKLVKTWMIEDE